MIGSDFAPTLVVNATVAVNENVPLPLSVNPCAAVPPIDKRSPVTVMPVLVGFVPGVTVTLIVVDAPGKTSAPVDLTFGDAIAIHRSLVGSVAPNETALYEIEFKPNPDPDDTIAIVRAGDAKSTLRVADLHPWNTASPRMKRASLAAAWARAPQSRKQTEEIVAKAREAHIDELADIAEQSVRIR